MISESKRSRYPSKLQRLAFKFKLAVGAHTDLDLTYNQNRTSRRCNYQSEGVSHDSQPCYRARLSTPFLDQLAGLCGSDLHIYRGHEDVDAEYDRLCPVYHQDIALNIRPV